MNISAIIAATILVAAVGLFIGVFLGAAGKKFAVEIDEKEVAIREALPGNNCGGCGYPGCDGLAAAIAKGEAPVNRKKRMFTLAWKTARCFLSCQMAVQSPVHMAVVALEAA